MNVVRIATRKSPLALWQAHAVQAALESKHAGLRCELVGLTTAGDRFLAAKLTEIGGKNLFVKELEEALLDGRADIAVHSMKDVTAELPGGLRIATLMAREDPRDALVSSRYAALAELPDGARVGTASSRRQCQLLAMRPDLEVATVRGNVNTRLARLDAGEYDALILAAAGLTRLGFEARVAQYLAPETMLPAAGQGVMGIECRGGDQRVETLLAGLANADASACVLAERAVSKALGGGCEAPLAAYAEVDDEMLSLRALVGSLDGRTVLRTQACGPRADPVALGTAVAEQLLSLGAAAVLSGV